MSSERVETRRDPKLKLCPCAIIDHALLGDFRTMMMMTKTRMSTCRRRETIREGHAFNQSSSSSSSRSSRRSSKRGTAHVRTIRNIMHLTGRALFWYFSAPFSSSTPFCVASTVCKWADHNTAATETMGIRVYDTIRNMSTQQAEIWGYG